MKTKFLLLGVLFFLMITSVLQANTYTNTSYYVSYNDNNKTQYVLVMPTVQKVYTHTAGHIKPNDLKQIDEQFSSFPIYKEGNLCFGILKDDASGKDGASLMESKCYEVNFFYTQKELIDRGMAFMLYYQPLEKVYEGIAGNADSFKVVKEEDATYNDHSITHEDYNGYVFFLSSATVKITDKSNENIKEIDIGVQGGELPNENGYIHIEKGTFSVSEHIELSVNKEEKFTDGQNIEVYTLNGLPKTFSKAITIAVKLNDLNESNDALLAIKIDTFIPSENTTQKQYEIVTGTIKDGYITYAFQPMVNDQNNSKLSSLYAKMKPYGDTSAGYMEISWAVVHGYRITDSEKEHFRIIYPKNNKSESDTILATLEDVYKYYINMGFSMDARKNWPMYVYLKSFGKDKVSTYGYFVQNGESRFDLLGKIGGIISNNYGFININIDPLTAVDANIELKATLAHEFFHFIQSLYYPSTFGIKNTSASLWLDEASAVWSEGNYIPGYISKIRDQNTVYLPFGGFASTQEYGYGMSALVKYLTDAKGTNILSTLYADYRDGSLDVTQYINNAAEDVFYWSKFIESYLSGKIYNDLEMVKLMGDKVFTIGKTAKTEKSIKLKDWQTGLYFFPFDRNFSSVIPADMKVKISGDISDVTLIAFNAKKSKEFEKVSYRDQSIIIKDINTLFGNGSYGVLLATTNGHIDPSKGMVKDINLTVSIISDRCPKSYKVDDYLEFKNADDITIGCKYYNNVLSREELSNDDRTDIVTTQYLDSGVIWSTSHWVGKSYLDSEETGKTYYDNGVLSLAWHMVNGKWEGPQKQYYESGQLSSEYSFHNEELNGTRILYYENGKVEKTEHYLDGKRIGESIGYYDTGKMQFDSFWKDDMLEGNCIEYRESGTKRRETMYHLGKKNGNDTYYNDSGIKFNETMYHLGKKDGNDTYYYDSGTIQSITPYVENSIEGTALFYYKSGLKQREVKYKNNVRDGSTTGYYESGELDYIDAYSDDLLDGKSISYYKSGYINCQSIYAQGTLQSQKCYNDGEQAE